MAYVDTMNSLVRTGFIGRDLLSLVFNFSAIKYHTKHKQKLKKSMENSTDKTVLENWMTRIHLDSLQEDLPIPIPIFYLFMHSQEQNV